MFRNKTKIEKINHIIISRTDNIGDVILTLPMIGIIKSFWPNVKISFLGKTYTAPILEACDDIDNIISWDKLKKLSKIKKISFFKSLNADVIIHVFPNKDIASIAKKAAIPIRIGTSRRIFHLKTCNKLIYLKRKNSKLHEAELNLKLLKGLKIDYTGSFNELANFIKFNKIKKYKELDNLVSKDKFNLIIHPKSKGSAREWGIENYNKLLELLSSKYFKIFVTGTKEEEKEISEKLLKKENVVNLAGKLNLSQLIYLISISDALLACSTGPLHLAAILGKHTLGIYSPMRPIHPGRWRAIGKNVKIFVQNKNCNICKNNKICNCILDIKAEEIYSYLIDLISNPLNSGDLRYRAS